MSDYSIEFLLEFGENNKELLDADILDNFLQIKKKNTKKAKPIKYKKNSYYFDETDNKEFNLLLNKLTHNNIDDIYKKCNELLTSPKNIELFIDAIFQCSISQPGYCKLYGKLIGYFNDNTIDIKTVLLEKCKLFYNTSDMRPISIDLIKQDYDLFCKINLDKHKLIGCFNLIGELYLYNMINNEILLNYLYLLINNIKTLEDDAIYKYVECLCDLIKNINKILKEKLNIEDYNKFSNILQQMSLDKTKFKPRYRFMLEDTYNIILK